MDLIPPRLVVERYFADQQAELDELTAKAQEATRAVEEYVEENSGDDGQLAEAMDDDKISKTLASARLKEARRENSDPDEVKALQHLIHLQNAEAAAKKAVKDAQAALDLATLRKYGDLTEPDVKQLVLDDKWGDVIASRIAGEVIALTLALVNRIQELGDRYAQTLEGLDAELAKVESKVAAHLADMGVK